MTAHQPAREGDGGSANIDKERPVSFKYTDSFFGSLFFYVRRSPKNRPRVFAAGFPLKCGAIFCNTQSIPAKLRLFQQKTFSQIPLVVFRRSPYSHHFVNHNNLE